MYERSSEFFVPFQKKFNFFDFYYNSEPNSQQTNSNNFSYVSLDKIFGFCDNDFVHYQVSQLHGVPEVNPCLFSSFKSLIFSSNRVISEAILDKFVFFLVEFK